MENKGISEDLINFVAESIKNTDLYNTLLQIKKSYGHIDVEIDMIVQPLYFTRLKVPTHTHFYQGEMIRNIIRNHPEGKKYSISQLNKIWVTIAEQAINRLTFLKKDDILFNKEKNSHDV